MPTSVIDSSEEHDEGVCVFEDGGPILHANLPWRRLAGLSDAGSITGHWGQWLKSQHPLAIANLEASLSSGGTHTAVLPHRLPTGETAELQVTVSHLAASKCRMACVKRVDTQAPRCPPPLPADPTPQPPRNAPGGSCDPLPALAALLRNSPQPLCVVRAPGACELAPAGPGAPASTSAPTYSSARTATATVAASSLANALRASGCGSGSGSWGGGGLEPPAPWVAYALLSPGPPSSGPGSEVPSRSGSHDSAALPASLPPPHSAPSPQSLLPPPVACAAPASLGAVLFHNDAMLQLCGYSGQQLRSGGLALLLRPPPPGACHTTPTGAAAAGEPGVDVAAASALASALAAGAPCSLELPCYHASGRKLLCQVHVSRLGQEAWPEHGDGQQQGEQPGWRSLYNTGGTSGGGCGAASSSGGDVARLAQECNADGATTRMYDRIVGGGATACASVVGREAATTSLDESDTGDDSACDSITRIGGERTDGSITRTSNTGACAAALAAASSPPGAAKVGTGSEADLAPTGTHTYDRGNNTHANTAQQQMQQSQQQRRNTVREDKPTTQHQQEHLAEVQRSQQHRPRPQQGPDAHQADPQDLGHPGSILPQGQQPDLGHTHAHTDACAHARRVADQSPCLLLSFNDVTAHWQLRQQHLMLQQPVRAPCPPSPLEQQAVLPPLGLQQVDQEQEQQTQLQEHQQQQLAMPHAALAREQRPFDLLASSHCLRDFALDCVREGITIADPSAPDSPIVYTNNSFLEMTGYSREEVLGRNCRFLQGPDTDPAAVSAIRAALSARRPVTVQLLNYTKAGRRFWNELRLLPVTQPGTGRLIAYVGFQNDVSELIARMQSEARLRDAKEAAESATEAKSQFLANMSHEIRTPLNGMIATAQLLLGSVLTPEQRELAETILESGSTLQGILGDILDFSKIDHGSLELQLRPMCLRQATEACIDLVAAEAAKKGLAVAYLLDDEALARPLLGDPVRVRQVLANLLSNAVKFTERGEVVVRVTVERAADCRSPHAAVAAAKANAAAAAPASASAATTADDGDDDDGDAAAGAAGAVPEEVVHIAVTDTGIGIGQESARKLFQHFRQGSETMSRRYGGTGLGLAISKRLAQLMDGDIWVDSRIGAGSTFHFTLRAEWVSAPGAWPWSPSRSAASTPSRSSECTPRTSTDEGPGGGASGSSIALTAASALEVGDAGGQPWGASASGGGSRLSGSSNGSGSARCGRELRTSPWLPDGTPIDGTVTSAGAPASPLSGLFAAGAPSVGSSTGGVSGGNGACGAAEAAEERAALLGRTVLVDVSHAATSTQVWNSCRQLGLTAVQDKACPPPLPPTPASYPSVPSAAAAAAPTFAPSSAAVGVGPGASASPPPPLYDILIVSMDRLVPALKAGWKGRPVVALGDREQLPPALQPLVVVTVLPVRHSRLATALVKATALLRWNGSSAPKLGNAPIPAESIQNLKSWRLKRGPDADSFNRRTSLDNSALERAVMARGALHGAAGGTAGRGGPNGKTSPARQQVPIPEHAELSALPDDTPPGKLPLPPPTVGVSSPAPVAEVVNGRGQGMPAPPPASPAPAAAPAVDAPGGGQQPQLQHLRILIAEDNKVNQKVVLKVLQQILRGCQPPDVVENGLQVLAALQKKSYDIILMDIHMPEMDGLEASKRIQETYRPEERPRIIALSADTVQTLHDRCREAGIEAFLVKPFRIEELARVMRTGPPRPRKPLEQELEPSVRSTPLTA